MLFPKIKGIKSFSSVYQALQACYRRHSFLTLDGVDYEAIFVRDIIMIHLLKKMRTMLLFVTLPILKLRLTYKVLITLALRESNIKPQKDKYVSP